MRVTALALAATLAMGPTFQRPPGSVDGTLTSSSGPTAGAVVYLIPLDSTVEVRPLDSAVIDQQSLRFVPRVLTVTPRTPVTFRNSDAVQHNVFSPPRIGADFDLGTYRQFEVRTRSFDEPGAYLILCQVHPEMVAYVVTVPTAWSAVVDATGQFHIADVPPGRYELHVWQRFLRDPLRTIAVAEGQVLRVTIPVEMSRRPRGRQLDEREAP